ncbi:hypothetical protein NW752_005998 [Fusarium irregulare]|uniref:Heterokaryon incompatibility domain-containing protein n=1 Tax=Fusarium irregulare TaxID=2494466 RepID=A0A9W8PNF5_9HYPO|nr:hypothetical protein NW766_006535 [Fusarium irregulare]KAJ4016924.1 hypothetical protein NW752_005998 [Fusarium irregulare]
MTEPLCAACSRFVDDIGEVEEEGWETILHLAPDFFSLAKLAQDGCPLCKVVYQSCCFRETVSYERQTLPISVRAWARALRRIGEEGNDDELPFGDQCPKQLVLLVSIGDSGKGRSHVLPVALKEDTEKPTETPDLDAAKPVINLCSSKGIDEAVALAKYWMLQCDRCHIQCKVRSQTQPPPRVLPTRLIDVGSIDREELPRLYVPNPADHGGLEYAALSYAWGSDPTFAKTTASNLDEMTKGLPWNMLAKTIQDAILFTRNLGIGYLWVDALCILQSEGPDDVSHRTDWAYEANRFGQYYENATLTIAATGAISSDKGLFLRRLGLENNPQPVTFRQKSFWGGFRDTTTRPILPSWYTEVHASPLFTRGWAFQERALSRRILHFGMNCIVWECHECRSIETDPTRLEPITSDHRNHDFVYAFRDLENQDVESAVRLWYNFAGLYSMAKFTFALDRLPALSGIAARFQNFFPQNYMAGLWGSNIIEGLVWGVPGVPDQRSPSLIDISRGVQLELMSTSSELTMPSWSWASSDRLINFFFEGCTPTFEVNGGTIQANGAETSGQLSHGTLRLEGKFLMVDLGCPCQPPSRSVLLDRYGYVSEDDLTSYLNNCLFPCFLLGTAILDIPWKDTRVVIQQGYALILQPTGRSVDSVEEYRRIGFVQIPYKEYWADITETTTIDLV